ncbi:MAG: P-loop NTPase [Desulfobulbaceae bacterium]|nr:P-loop NTPase [Desulfobulbaceae bacterium]
MREIVVLSGKGGVGKSSLAAAMGTLLAEKYSLVLSDTDVDAPNLHLVLGAKADEVSDITASEKAFIDYDQCNNCMQCVDVCRFSSIIGEDEPVIISYSCEGCGACAITCPVEAIEIKPVVNGKLNLLTAGKIRVVSGGLSIGDSSSGRLVDVVKNRARKEAEAINADHILTDGPPGIGCPVIASLKGADYVVLVTEPTPSALNDLQRVVEVIGFFKIPVGIVLNRADMHGPTRDRILRFIEQKNFDLLAEIPYDPFLPQALAEGALALQKYPEAPSSVAIRNLTGELENSLHESV